MKIAILGAMREEIEPILPKIENLQKHEYAANIYYTGKLCGKEIAMAYSKIGKVNAALTATVLIEKFGCQKLLFSGVAGGINENLKIGDLIFAQKLVQHDVDITAFGHPWGFIPESGDFIEADESLNELAKKVADKLGVKIIGGTIATGDQFIASEEKKEWIKTTYNADALEMEGASVGYVCQCLGVPFFVLRAISDTADMDAGFSFEEFLVSSAKVSANFLENMIDEL
jgi:adenosylhomocysteine/aminodeoxyfutalosine nucleosidase